MKPGYKTTEFWLTLLATIVGTLMTSGVIGDGTQLAKILGMVAVVLGALGYTVVRGGVKKSTGTPLVGEIDEVKTLNVEAPKKDGT